MIENQETIKKIRLFGLNTYEAKIWVAFLSKGTSTAGELSDMANVPRSRSYDILQSLEKKGFVVMKLGKPIRYLAVPPKEVLDNIKTNIEKKTEKHLSQIESSTFNNMINTFQELHEKNTNNMGNVVAILKGRKNIYKHLNFLVSATSKKDSIILLGDEEEALKSINKLKANQKAALMTANTGPRMCVAGADNVVLFPIDTKDTHPDYDMGIWIKNKHTTDFLRQLMASALQEI